MQGYIKRKLLKNSYSGDKSMKKFDLNGIWDFVFYEKQSLENVDIAQVKFQELMAVPACFDCMPHQYCQRGCAVYSRTFFLEESWASSQLRIDGMGLRGKFFIDGKEIGSCAMPYSNFTLDCGKLSAGEHCITALLDNNLDPDKMKLFRPNYDFYAFGGFYHGVSLELSQEVNPLTRVFIRTTDYKTGKLNLEFVFKNEVPATFTAFLSINGEAEKEYTITNGKLDLVRPDLSLWSPDSPAVHTLRVRTASDIVTETFGVRQIAVDGANLLLNGEVIHLKGFNRHESAPVSGAATTTQQMIMDLQHLKTLNANFIRGCHYQQSDEFLSLCDRMGFMVWEESLGWGNVESILQDPEFVDLQVEQTRLMVRQSINHPSVIIYGFLNELDSRCDAAIALCKKLYDTIKAEDTGRPVTFADCSRLADRALQYMDILTVNAYPGWIQMDYAVDPLDAIPPTLEKLLGHLRTTHGPDKPIIVSEMGCCGLYGQHDEAAAQWTEEFQAGYLEKVIDTVASYQDVAGLALWQLNDAKSYHRTGSIIRVKPLAQNLAGVYDQYRRPKLAAKTVAEKFKHLYADK